MPAAPSVICPPPLNRRTQARVHVLWDEVAAFDVAQTEAALMHLLSTVAALVDAENAYWMGAIRMRGDKGAPLSGWQPQVIRYLRPLPNDDKFTHQRLRALKRGRTIDELTMAQARLVGTFRARRFRDLVSDAWFKDEAYAGYVGRGVYDSLTVGVPVNAAAEGYYGFLRMRPDVPFTEAQRDLAYHALRGLNWFHRQVLLAHGLVGANAALQPMERRVFALLLSDRPEKLIAEELGVTPSTLHTYVRVLSRKFGVSGRSGLVALWLRRHD